MDPTSIRVLLGSSNQESYWILQSSYGGNFVEPIDVKIDIDGNIYVYIGFSVSESAAVLVKLNGNGELIWHYDIPNVSGGNFSSVTGGQFAVSPNGNVFLPVIGAIGEVGDEIGFIRLNSSGVFQSYKFLNVSNFIESIASSLNSSNDIYVSGYNAILAKWNSSNILQWQSQINGASLTDRIKSIAVDNSGNIYCSALLNISSSLTGTLIKYNSSGSLIWSRVIEQFSFLWDTATDSLGNVYTLGGGSGIGGQTLIKYNSSGVLQWQKRIGGAYMQKVVVDSSNFVYAVGHYNTQDDGFICKFDSSGNIQWQRTLDAGGTDQVYLYGISIDGRESIIATGKMSINSGNSAIAITLKLPSDGSLTGTYGNLSYTESSLSIIDDNLNESAGSFTSSLTSYTETSSSITPGNIGSYSSTLTYI